MKTKARSKSSPYQFFIIAILTAFVFLAGCSGADKPSEKEATEALTSFVKKNLPYDLKKVEILEWGPHNSEKQYWPVKVNIHYSRKTNPFSDKKEAFQKEHALKLYADDFGEWKAKG